MSDSTKDLLIGIGLAVIAVAVLAWMDYDNFKRGYRCGRQDAYMEWQQLPDKNRWEWKPAK